MAFRTAVLFFAQAILIQCITAQCNYNMASPFNTAAPYTNMAGYNAASVPASNGGGFAISSASPIMPSGVSVLSENAVDGSLAVGGQLPLLGTVALEGALPTAGAGGVTYGCGNGNVGITAEEAGPGYNAMAFNPAYSTAYPAAYGPGFNPAFGAAGYNPAGCGAVY